MFEEVSAAAGLLQLAGSTFGPAWGDFNIDGHLDLFLARSGHLGSASTNTLLLNQGDGTFVPLNVGSPLHSSGSFAAVWGDYDNDGFLDLLLPCMDSSLQRSPNLLFRNNLPDAGNQNRWLKVQLDGRASNRSGIGAVLRLRATLSGQEMWQTRQIASNGNTWGQGPELVDQFGLGDATTVERVIIEWPSGNVTQLTNQAVNQTLSITETVSITPARPSASLNGAVTLSTRGTQLQWQFEGVDLPGQTSWTLVLTNLTAEQAGRYSVVVDNGTTVVTNFTYLTVDPTFTKITEGSPVTDLGCSFSVVWGDYDNDGFLDLYVVNGNDPGTVNTANFLYRNNGNENGWLKVKLIGTTSNREGIGAKVRMLPLGRGQPWQRRDITGGDAFNGNQLYAHFGLGSATSVQTLRIEWPSGIVQELENIPAKQMITVIEPHLQGAFDDTGAFRIAVRQNVTPGPPAAARLAPVLGLARAGRFRRQDTKKPLGVNRGAVARSVEA